MSQTTIKPVSELHTKIFADGADKAAMLSLYQDPVIRGFTTNPTLMRNAGIRDYQGFAREVLEAIPDRPISFEVFADEQTEMCRQAKIISSWGTNVYVKLPVTNTRRSSVLGLVRSLALDGVKVNVTAILTEDQIAQAVDALAGGAPSYVSVFAGRIADTGRDPLPMMREAVRMMAGQPQMELIWASPRELLNIYQAHDIGCHVITVTPDILKKLRFVGKDLADYSLETVKMFFDDGKSSGFVL